MAVDREIGTSVATHAVAERQVLSNLGVGRKSYAHIPTVLEMPNLVQVQIESFTTDVKVIAKAAAIWRRMEPTRDEIAVKGLKNLKKFFGK